MTNPEEYSVPEEMLLRSDGTYIAVAHSNKVPIGQLLMTDDQLALLRSHLAAIHTKFAELYGVEQGERFAMEIEFKITSDNVLAVKQARPWIFSGSPPEVDDSSTGGIGPPLTVRFENIQATQHGYPFWVSFRFSEGITTHWPEFMEHSMAVTGGVVTSAVRSNNQGSFWVIEITPDSYEEDVVLSLAHDRSCTVPGAICTQDGRRLSNSLEYTVEGLHPDFPRPPAPELPTGRVRSPSVVELGWNDVPRADYYQVQLSYADRWISLPGNGTEIEFDGAGAVVRGLPAADIHQFRVRGVNPHGVSEWSPHLSVPMRADWESELTAALGTGVSPGGVRVFDLRKYGRRPVARQLRSCSGPPTQCSSWYTPRESLWLGVHPELPEDFSLWAGGLTYLGSESKVPHTTSGAGGYWWPLQPTDPIGGPTPSGWA